MKLRNKIRTTKIPSNAPWVRIFSCVLDTCASVKTFRMRSQCCGVPSHVSLWRHSRSGHSGSGGPMGMAFSWRGCPLQTTPPPQLGEDPPCWGPGVMWSSGRTGVAQLVARSTPDWCVVGSSPTCGTERFGFPPSAPRLGNQRPWYVQPRLCDWAYKRSRATYQKEKGIVSRWSVSS